MNKRNYQKELEQVIAECEKSSRVPTLLVHSCCAPCSSYVLEYLSGFFEITVFYFNPNIFPPEEYKKREEEQQELIEKMDLLHPAILMKANYRPEDFYNTVKGFEQIPEGGKRCFRCYELRLSETARIAKELGFDYFTTTLSISPLKNAGKLNEIGERLALENGIPYLVSDFKKKNGYRRSVELSAEYGLYRQDYCGCIFSKHEREGNGSVLNNE